MTNPWPYDQGFCCKKLCAKLLKMSNDKNAKELGEKEKSVDKGTIGN